MFTRPTLLTLHWLLYGSMALFLFQGLGLADDPPLGEAPISPEGMLQHVKFLASPELRGRGSLADRIVAADYIADWFARHNVQPLFDGRYFQPIPDGNAPGTDEPRIIGRNVGGFIPGSDPVLRKEIIVINAHYDHLGMRRGVIFPGADDNASGVAMLLESARHVAAMDIKPKRTIAFVAFDLEENLLWGSRWFVSNAPWDIEQIKLCLTADLISRSLGGFDMPTVFVLGSEKAPALKQVLANVGTPEGLEVAQLSIDMIGTRSDYGPFRDREIPFLFFSTGEHPDYHQPTDTPDRINPPKAAAIATLMRNVAIHAANMSEAPAWDGDRSLPETDVSEVEAVNRITKLLIEADDNGTNKLGNASRVFVSQVEAKTSYVLRKGRISPQERQWLNRSVQVLLISVF